MIIALIGGVGSGKTLTAVKLIKESKIKAMVNFNAKLLNAVRIKESDIIIKGEKKDDWRVNWEYWDRLREKRKDFSVYLDEVHNLIHSRNSMSKRNILMSKWVSQIRKILSDSETCHLYIISQTLRKIDIDFKELVHLYITCQKFKHGPQIWIKNRYYDEAYLYDPYAKPKAVMSFLGNPYFQYYDTNEMVKFGDDEKFI